MGGSGGGGGYSDGSSAISRIKLPPRPAHIPVDPTEASTGGGAGGGGGAGNGGGAGGAGGGGGADECWITPFETTVASPVLLAIRKTREGQVLDIVAKGNSVCVNNLLNETCGVVLTNAARLLKCLQQKRRFKATVMEVNLAELRVEIHNA